MSGLNKNLQVAKTFKLFIGGDFPRTESGRSFPVYKTKSKEIYAHLCLASRKDLRNAITAAQSAQSGWQNRSAYNRGQILYRMAEMMEGKRQEFVETLTETLGYTQAQANKSVDTAIESFIYFAGFTDKYQQLVGTVNPVSGPHHNFTSCEPVGLVGLIASTKFSLGDLVSQICAIISSGNAVVVLMQSEGAATISPLAEVFATSDLPKGVINLLTGDVAELYKHFGSHMEVQSLSFQSADKKILAEVQALGVENMKRIIPPIKNLQSLEHILNYVEYKTVWHPIGY